MMAGLLDAFNSDEGLLGLGLLMAAAPSPQNIGVGARLGSALNWVQGQKDSRVDREAQMMRMEAYRQQQEQAKAAQQRDMQFQQALQQGASPSQLANIFPEKIDLLKKLADAPNFGRQEVARTVDVVGPNSQKMVRQLDKFGQPVAEDVAGYVPPQLLTLGNRQMFATPQAGASYEVGMSPAERDASARGWKAQSLAEQRMAYDMSQGDKPQYIADLGGFVNPRNRVVMPAMDASGNPIPTSGKTMTEDQAKASGWLVQANNAYTNMLAALKSNPNASRPGVNDAIAGIPSFGMAEGLANMMRGPDRQKFIQSADSLSEALLRAATGAGVNKDEARQKARELTPQIGDSEEVILQKQKAIPLYIESLKVRAGPGAKQVAPIINGEPPITGKATLKWNPKTNSFEVM